MGNLPPAFVQERLRRMKPKFMGKHNLATALVNTVNEKRNREGKTKEETI